MTATGNPLGAKFLNAIAKETREELVELARDVLDEIWADGYPPGTKPITLTDLKKMPIDQAVDELDRMLANPAKQAEAVRLAGAYYPSLAAALGISSREEPVYG